MKSQSKVGSQKRRGNKKGAINLAYWGIMAKKQYIFLTVVACIGFVVLVAGYRLFIKKPTYIYARVKVGQGYWWASTQKPSLWYVQAIKNAGTEKDLVGKPIVKILNVTYYPYYGSSQFDIYVDLQLKIDGINKKGSYSFKRETIGIGSPIDLEFSAVQFSGTIISLSTKKMKDEFVEKTVYLSKRYSYPWEFDSIKIGDYFDNGNGKVIMVLEKAKGETNEMFFNELGKLVSTDSNSYQNIFLKVKMKVKKEESGWVYGEEIIIAPGRSIGFITHDFSFNDYVVTKIE